MPAVFRRPHRAPADPETRAVEAGEWPLESADVGERILLGTEHVVHDDFAGEARAQADLAVNRRRAETLHALLENESANDALVVFRPDDEDIRDRAVADPRLCPGER